MQGEELPYKEQPTESKPNFVHDVELDLAPALTSMDGLVIAAGRNGLVQKEVDIAGKKYGIEVYEWHTVGDELGGGRSYSRQRPTMGLSTRLSQDEIPADLPEVGQREKIDDQRYIKRLEDGDVVENKLVDPASIRATFKITQGDTTEEFTFGYFGLKRGRMLTNAALLGVSRVIIGSEGGQFGETPGQEILIAHEGKKEDKAQDDKVELSKVRELNMVLGELIRRRLDAKPKPEQPSSPTTTNPTSGAGPSESGRYKIAVGVALKVGGGSSEVDYIKKDKDGDDEDGGMRIDSEIERRRQQQRSQMAHRVGREALKGRR